MELAIAFLGLWAFIVFAPDTPICGLLRQLLIDLPIKALARIGRGHVIAIAIVAAAIAFLDKELALAVSMSPEAIAYLAMIDVGVLIDATVGIMLVATTARFPRVAAILRSARPRARTTRARRPLRPASSNDDEDRAGYALAA